MLQAAILSENKNKVILLNDKNAKRNPIIVYIINEFKFDILKSKYKIIKGKAMYSKDIKRVCSRIKDSIETADGPY